VLSLAQSDYCKKKSFDPEDPRCAQLTLTGKFVKVPKKIIQVYNDIHNIVMC